MATKEEDRCTAKEESMDTVHGRERRHQSWKRPPSSQDGGLALLGLVVRPTVTSPLELSGRWSPCHRNGNSCSSFAWCSLVDCFIHENGNCGAVITTRRHAHDSAVGVEPMCALSRRQSWLPEEGNPTRLEASPSLWLGALSRGGPLPREKTLGEARQAWRASPGLESLVLSEIFLRVLWALAGRPVVPWFPLCRQ